MLLPFVLLDGVIGTENQPLITEKSKELSRFQMNPVFLPTPSGCRYMVLPTLVRSVLRCKLGLKQVEACPIASLPRRQGVLSGASHYTDFRFRFFPRAKISCSVTDFSCRENRSLRLSCWITLQHQHVHAPRLGCRHAVAAGYRRSQRVHSL